MSISRRRWLIGIIAAWAVLLSGFAFFWPDRAPTVKEQVSAGESRPAVDEAMTAAVREVSGYEGVTFTIGGFDKVADCRLTPVRSGEAYAQVVSIYARPEEARTVFKRLYEALREPYGLLSAGDGGYVGTAPTWVSTRLLPSDDGPMTWTLETGCRPVDEPVAQLRMVGHPTGEAALVAAALGMSGTSGGSGTRWTWEEVACESGASEGAGGAVVTTVTATSSEGVTPEAVTQAATLLTAYAGTGEVPSWYVGLGSDSGATPTVGTVLTYDAETGVATVGSTVGCP